MTDIRIIAAKDLTPDLISQWKSIASADHYLQSPFFQPEYTQAVAQVRDDVQIALIEKSGALTGLFPFQRTSNGLARNVCSRLSEFHGPIVLPNTDFDAAKVMRAAGIRSWQFDHLPLAGSPIPQHIWGTSTSPFLDLSQGYDCYLAERKAGKSSSVNQTLRKARKVEREVGPLRFEYNADSQVAFASLIKWKDAQHDRTGRLRVLQYDWIVELLRNLSSTNDYSLGLFSTLHAGDQLLAVHLGLRTESVIHLWFPTYDPAFEKYSPGLILLLRLAEEGARRGISRLDLGKGKERYKGSFKSGDVAIGEGAVDLRLVAGPLRRGWYETKRWIRQSPWQKQFDWPFEVSRRLRQRLAFD